MNRPGVMDSKGLYGKYYGLRRTKDAKFGQSRDAESYTIREGSLVEGWYFVIREGDSHGWAALLAYADSCEAENAELAADLRQRVQDERLMQGLYDSQWER